MQSIYEGDRAFYDRHILYKLMGITKKASQETISYLLRKEGVVMKNFAIQQAKELEDFNSRQIAVTENLVANFRRARAYLNQKDMREIYDIYGDQHWDPPLPHLPVDFNEPSPTLHYAPPSFPAPAHLQPLAPGQVPEPFRVPPRGPSIRGPYSFCARAKVPSSSPLHGCDAP